MNFEPFDTGLIMRRLRASVPELHVVGGAADYAAVKELRGFRTPSAYVVFAEDTNTWCGLAWCWRCATTTTAQASRWPRKRAA